FYRSFTTRLASTPSISGLTCGTKRLKPEEEQVETERIGRPFTQHEKGDRNERRRCVKSRLSRQQANPDASRQAKHGNHGPRRAARVRSLDRFVKSGDGPGWQVGPNIWRGWCIYEQRWHPWDLCSRAEQRQD